MYVYYISAETTDIFWLFSETVRNIQDARERMDFELVIPT